MGEYAIRKSDKQEIKIGTCENMYYLRYEDCDKVKPLPGSEIGFRFRLPFPDEDEVLPGKYEKYNRGERLFKETDQDAEQLEIQGDDTGIIQLSHPCGLLINVPCHHGRK